MELVEPLEDWCKRYNLPMEESCYNCASIVKAKKTIATRLFRGVEYESCCGSASATAIRIDGDHYKKLKDILSDD